MQKINPQVTAALAQTGGAVAQTAINNAANNKMYDRETFNNRLNADLSYKRSLDYKAQMAAYKDAGINPYMVMDKSYTAPVAQSAQYKPRHNTDLSGISAIPMAILQAQLINAQKNNVNANTENTQANTATTQFNLSVDQKYKHLDRELGQDIATQTRENLKQTNTNLQTTNDLLNKQIVGQETTNSIQAITLKFAEVQKKLEVATSKEEINNLRLQASQLQAATDQIRSFIKLNEQNLITGQMTQAQLATSILKIIEETQTIKESRKPTINATERSNVGQFGPIIKAFQLAPGESWQERQARKYKDYYYDEKKRSYIKRK